MRLSAVYYFLRYLVILMREVTLSSINVAKLALGPLDRLSSGFVALRTEGQTDLEITLLANSITLTPGTITIHVDPEKRLLVMHAIDVGQDPEELRQSTRTVLEANILRWTRAGRGRRKSQS